MAHIANVRDVVFPESTWKVPFVPTKVLFNPTDFNTRISWSMTKMSYSRINQYFPFEGSIGVCLFIDANLTEIKSSSFHKELVSSFGTSS
jgi:hypothetical protein